jgi:hypothetical protein
LLVDTTVTVVVLVVSWGALVSRVICYLD